MTAFVLLVLGALLVLALSAGIKIGAILTGLVLAWIAWSWFDEFTP